MIDSDWDLFTETMAHAQLGWAEGEPAHQVAALLRQYTTPEAWRAMNAAADKYDVSSLLPEIQSPTLVLHRAQYPLGSVDAARELAARIPGARLAMLEGDSVMPFLGDSETVFQAIDEFLGEGKKAGAEQKDALPEGTAIILFLDIADSTALTEQLGDAAFRARARELDASLRATIKEAGGVAVEGKVLGDGVMEVFTSARQAIECALRCATAGDSCGLGLHLGIHAGDVIREGNNVYGGAVNIASRVASASAPGEILVTDTVRGLARTSAGVRFEDRGEQELKGIADPQHLFAVRARES